MRLSTLEKLAAQGWNRKTSLENHKPKRLSACGLAPLPSPILRVCVCVCVCVLAEEH